MTNPPRQAEVQNPSPAISIDGLAAVSANAAHNLVSDSIRLIPHDADNVGASSPGFLQERELALLKQYRYEVAPLVRRSCEMLVLYVSF